jgi:hypothetical protein
MMVKVDVRVAAMASKTAPLAIKMSFLSFETDCLKVEARITISESLIPWTSKGCLVEPLRANCWC